MTGYVYDSAWEQERRRLAGIEAMFDGFTAAVFDRVGVQPGWRCLDVGAGGGSVARGLAARGASVVATDLDIRHLERLGDPRVEVRRHDLLADELEPASFDLVHARMVLEHIPQRDTALRRMRDAVKLGGWLVIEDLEFTEEAFAGDTAVWPESVSDARRAATRAILTLMTAAGFDGGYARRLPWALLALGLEDVACESRSKLIHGGSIAAAFSELSLMQLRESLVAAGMLTEEQAATALRAIRDPGSAWMTFPLVSAWGRTPS